MLYPITIISLLIELFSAGLLLALACRRFRGGAPGKTGYCSALMGGASLIDLLSRLLSLFPNGAQLLPTSLTRMLTALCLTFFFLLLFQEGAKAMEQRALFLAADLCAGLRMLMCITSANNWTGTALFPFWAEVRTALLFVLGLIAVSVWFLVRRERKAVWLAAGATLILCIPPELYGSEHDAGLLLLALSQAAAAACALLAHRTQREA